MLMYLVTTVAYIAFICTETVCCLVYIIAYIRCYLYISAVAFSVIVSQAREKTTNFVEVYIYIYTPLYPA